MSATKYFKSSLFGTLEMFLLMPTASKYFENDRKLARRSYLVPLIVMLYITGITYHVSFESFGDVLTAYLDLILWGIFFVMIKYTIFLSLVYNITKMAKRKEYYHKFVHANNWLAVGAALVLTPPWIMMFLGMSFEEALPYTLCSVFYIYLVLSIASHYILRLSWLQAYLVPVASLMANGFVSVLFGKLLGGMWVF